MDAPRRLSWWQYEAEMLRRAKNCAKSHLVLEVAIVVGTALAASMTEAAIKSNIDWTTLLIAVAGGLGGILATLWFFLLGEPNRAHNALIAIIEQRAWRFDFSARLRERADAIERVTPLGSSMTDLVRARRQIEEQQVLFIKSLRRQDTPWQFAPEGWADSLPELHAWAGLASVMAQRYEDELSPIGHLYEITGDGASISLENFRAVQAHSIQTIKIVVREIEYPERAKRTESPGTFAATLALFRPPAGPAADAPKG